MLDLNDDEDRDDLEVFRREVLDLAWQLFHFQLVLELGPLQRKPYRTPIAGYADYPALTQEEGDLIRAELLLASLQRDYAIIHAGLIAQGAE